MTAAERQALKKAKRREKRQALGVHKRKEGSLKSEMEHRIRERAKSQGNQLTHHYRDSAIRACYQFDEWRKLAGYTNKQVRENPKAAVEEWAKFLARPMTEEEQTALQLRRCKKEYAPASIHTMAVGVCLRLNLDMSGICSTGTALDKKKSTGLSVRAEKAIPQQPAENKKNLQTK